MNAAFNRVPLGFRLGITGARKIGSHIEAAVRSELSEVLGFIAQEIEKLVRAPESQAVYDTQSKCLRLLSPLAEGSDRLAAEEALKRGYVLYAPLPFPQSEYEEDFPESVGEFRALLSKADVLALDGAREFADESYREVGRYVARNCDLLVAVWDGKSERGPGGTAEIVRFAANARVPVWWIDPFGRSAARLIDDPKKLSSAGNGDLRAAAFDDLKRYVERTVVPPKIESAKRPGAFGRMAHLLSRAYGRDISPLNEYLGETDVRTKGIWRSYSIAMNALARNAKSIISGKLFSNGPTGESQWWLSYFRPADKLSEAYGNRYRSSYVLIAALAIVVAASEMGELLPSRFENAAYMAETIATIAIAALVFANYYYRWHERWISYRLLAELFRKQAMLWTIGRSLPTHEIVTSILSSEEPEDDALPILPRDAWIGWYFAAVSRCAPPLTGPFEAQKLDAAATANMLVEEQIQYHRRRILSSRAAASRMEKAGQLFLFVAALVVVMKIIFWLTHPAGSHSEWLKDLGIFLSATSASFVTLRAYSELPLLAQQSSRMIKVLKNAESELAAIDVAARGASRELGHTMNSLALSMMQDVTGWMQLFRLKSLESPDVH